MTQLKLLSVGADAKTVKGEKLGVRTAILYLAPFTEASKKFGKKVNLCPHASSGCSASCLFTAGRGKMPSVYNSRLRKTLEFLKHRGQFLKDLSYDIRLFAIMCERDGFIPAVRLNGTSDLPWEKLIDFSRFPEVQFYDYTKVPSRMFDNIKGKHPENYHLTFSKDETNEKTAREVLSRGGNVAVVFEERPKTFWRRKVVSGDDTDARFLDRKCCVVGLSAKGKAIKDTTGFVIRKKQAKK